MIWYWLLFLCDAQCRLGNNPQAQYAQAGTAADVQMVQAQAVLQPHQGGPYGGGPMGHAAVPVHSHNGAGRWVVVMSGERYIAKYGCIVMELMQLI